MPWLLAGSLGLAMMLSAAQPAAAAGPPITASGGFTQVSFVQSNVRGAGRTTHFDFTEHDSLTGTFDGTSVIDGSCVVRPSGQTVCHASEEFTGTVAGESGTATFNDVVFIDGTGAVHGAFSVITGTGDLTGLHGHGTFEGSAGTGTYTGRLVLTS